MKKIYFIIVFISAIFSQKISENGLEINTLKEFSISIGPLNDIAKEIGLSKKEILETIKLKLQDNETTPQDNQSTYLLINIDCLPLNYSDGRSTGMYVYNIQTNFIRPVTFKRNEEFLSFSNASVWNNYSSGFTNNSYTIINDLLRMIDTFSFNLKSANK